MNPALIQKARELVEHYAKTIELYDALLKTGDPRISRDTPERAQLVRTTHEVLKALLDEIGPTALELAAEAKRIGIR